MSSRCGSRGPWLCRECFIFLEDRNNGLGGWYYRFVTLTGTARYARQDHNLRSTERRAAISGGYLHARWFENYSRQLPPSRRERSPRRE